MRGKVGGHTSDSDLEIILDVAQRHISDLASIIVIYLGLIYGVHSILITDHIL